MASGLREVVISFHIQSIVSSLGLASTRKMLTNWISGGHQDEYGAGAQDIEGEVVDSWVWSVLRTELMVKLIAVYNHIIRR